MKTKTKNKSSSFLMLSVIILLISCNQTTQPTVKDDQKVKEAAMIELTHTCGNIWKTGNLDLVKEVYSPEIVRRWIGEPDVIGIEPYKKELIAIKTGFPDIDYTVNDIFVRGDKVYYEVTLMGTHTGTFHGIPPTGKKINITFMEVDRIVDGKIVEETGYMNQLTLFQQLGFELCPAE